MGGRKMSEPRKTIKPILNEKEEKEDLPKLQIDLRNDSKSLIANPLSPEERYLRRKLEVTERDHDEFLAYLEAKRAREEENRTEETARGQLDSAPDKMAGASPSKLDRRTRRLSSVQQGRAAPISGREDR